MDRPDAPMTLIERLTQIEKRVMDIREHEADKPWAERALANLADQVEVLGELAEQHDLSAKAVLPRVGDVAYGGAAADVLTDDQKWAVLWQMREHLNMGEFKKSLLETSGLADPEGLEALQRAYPALIEGITRWRSERGYADRIRAIVVDFR